MFSVCDFVCLPVCVCVRVGNTDFDISVNNISYSRCVTYWGFVSTPPPAFWLPVKLNFYWNPAPSCLPHTCHTLTRWFRVHKWTRRLLTKCFPPRMFRNENFLFQSHAYSAMANMFVWVARTLKMELTEQWACTDNCRPKCLHKFECNPYARTRRTIYTLFGLYYNVHDMVFAWMAANKIRILNHFSAVHFEYKMFVCIVDDMPAAGIPVGR